MEFKDKKIFIGCSSRSCIDQKYLLLAKNVAEHLVERGYNLVFGAASFGMMGECYQIFCDNKKSIYSHTVSKYVDDLKKLESSEKYIHATTFERTKSLYQDADVILFLPGGTGTISEIFSILEENRTALFPKKVFLYNYEGYYDKLLDLINYCVKNKFNDESIFDYFKVVETIDELINEINEMNINK